MADPRIENLDTGEPGGRRLDREKGAGDPAEGEGHPRVLKASRADPTAQPRRDEAPTAGAAAAGMDAARSHRPDLGPSEARPSQLGPPHGPAAAPGQTGAEADGSLVRPRDPTYVEATRADPGTANRGTGMIWLQIVVVVLVVAAIGWFLL